MRPRTREHLRILDRHFVADGVGTDRRVTLHQAQRVAVEVPGSIEPVLAVEVRHLDDQRISFPAADRVAHVGIVGRALDLVQVDHATRVRERVGHVNLVRALNDRERIRHVHRARNARQVALELWIAVDPVLAVLLFDRGGFRPVRNLAVALHDAERPGHACRGTQGENRRRRDPGVLVSRRRPSASPFPRALRAPAGPNGPH